MLVIYYSTRPSPLPQVAAFLHCRKIFQFSLSTLDRPAESGSIRRFGNDTLGNQIFFMHCSKGALCIERMLTGFGELLWENKESLQLVNTSETENPLTKMGFFLYYRLGVRAVGEKIFNQGLVRSLPELQGLVERVRLHSQLKNK